MRTETNLQPNALIKALSRRELFWLVVALLVFVVVADGFAAYFVGHENCLYFWDYKGYWQKLVNLNDEFALDPTGAMRDVIVSIGKDDYNLFPVVLLLPVIFFAGGSRLVYILSVVDIFALAAVALFLLLQVRLIKVSGRWSPIVPLISVAIVLLSPNFWNPILYGYLDVGGLVVINAILLLVLTGPLLEEARLKCLSIAVLTPIAILFRRWYAYWVVSFYSVWFVVQCFSVFPEHHSRAGKLWKILLITGAQITISILILVAVAPNFTLRAATTNYADIYSAYRFSSSVFESVLRVVDQFGFFVFFLFLAGAAQAVADEKTRSFSVLLLVQWVVIVVLFSRTQDFGPHHFYLLLPATLLFSGFFVARLFMKLGIWAVSCVGVLLFMNFSAAFSAEEMWYQHAFGHLFTDIRHPPVVRRDVNEIDRMLDVLQRTLTDPDDRVYVLASSLVLNSSLLDSAYLSLSGRQDVAKQILRTHDVDKRDGFPLSLLTAKYVVVADPIQYHLGAVDQRVVGIPAELILTGKSIGTSYVKLPYEFSLDGDVKCYLYKKVKEFNRSDLIALSQIFKSYYPDRPNVYQVSGS